MFCLFGFAVNPGIQVLQLQDVFWGDWFSAFACCLRGVDSHCPVSRRPRLLGCDGVGLAPLGDTASGARRSAAAGSGWSPGGLRVGQGQVGREEGPEVPSEEGPRRAQGAMEPAACGVLGPGVTSVSLWPVQAPRHVRPASPHLAPLCLSSLGPHPSGSTACH